MLRSSKVDQMFRELYATSLATLQPVSLSLPTVREARAPLRKRGFVVTLLAAVPSCSLVFVKWVSAPAALPWVPLSNMCNLRPAEM